MPVDPLLDFAALTAPIPGDDPSGGATPFAVRQQLDEARKEVDPDSFSPDDPLRPTEFKRADWNLVIRLCKDSLTTKAKDLLVAARLTEALTKQNGFAGLRDGLSLLRQLVSDCWDRLAPAIEDPSDLDIRSGPFEWLDDADRGGRFPSSVRQVPLVFGEEGPLSWSDWKRGQDGKDDGPSFEKAVIATPPETCLLTVETLKEVREELDQLATAIGMKLGQAAPGMTQLRKAVDDCGALAQLILQRKGPVNSASTETAADVATPGGTTSASGGGAGGGGGRAGSRDAIYKQLGELARELERIEPHSPIPYLVRRAVSLGALPFHEMIKNFVRDANVYAELARELEFKIPE